MSDFALVVEEQLQAPCLALCELFAEEKAYEEYTFFSGILNLLSDPADEPMILTAAIELSRCAFLGFDYSSQAKQQIDELLDNAIVIAHTMSAGSVN